MHWFGRLMEPTTCPAMAYPTTVFMNRVGLGYRFCNPNSEVWDLGFMRLWEWNSPCLPVPETKDSFT